MSEPSTQSRAYEPFPTFESFASGGVDLSAYGPAKDTFIMLKSSVGEEAMQQAVDTATRWAAVDTGAIEGLYNVDRGFTFSVAASAAALDNAHMLVGDDVARAIKDAVAGYEFVLDVATTEREPSENWIKELHSVLCASQETYRVITDLGVEDRELVKGAYKDLPNSPVNVRTGEVHSYAPPLDTPSEMSRLVGELRSDSFVAAHPVLQASYAHYAFVCIHPFPDGNGRVARALASTYLYRDPGVPLVVFADQKNSYIDALEQADRNDPRALIGFIRERAVDTMLMVTTTMQRPRRPDPAERIAHLNRVMQSNSGMAHTEIDALLYRVQNAWTEALTRSFDLISQPLTAALGQMSIYREQPGYRILKEVARTHVTVASPAPATGQATRIYSYQIARPGTNEADFAIFEEVADQTGNAPKLCDVHLREVNPTVSPALTYRLDALAADAVAVLVDEAVAAGEAALRKAGYIE